jgi:hypothetical protein
MTPELRKPVKQAASSGIRALQPERRVDVGKNNLNPDRVAGPSTLSAPIPKGQNNTGAPKRMPVKRGY